MKRNLILTLIVTTITVLLFLNHSVARTATNASYEGGYHDIVVDDARKLLYFTEPSTGSLHIASTETVQITQTISIGTGPMGIDISPDGDELAVAVHGDELIAYVDLITLSVISETTTFPEPEPEVRYPKDVVYGREGQLYVLTATDGLDQTYQYATWYTIDADTKEIVRDHFSSILDAEVMGISVDKNYLYINRDDSRLYRFTASTDVLDISYSTPGYRGERFCFLADGSIVNNSGQIWSADLQTRISSVGVHSDYIYCSESDSNIYFISVSWVDYPFVGDYAIVSVDTDTWEKTGIHVPHSDMGIGAVNGTHDYLYVEVDGELQKLHVNYEPLYSYLPYNAKILCHDYYFEDFEDDNHGWIIMVDLFVGTNIQDGEYRVRTKSSDYFYTFPAAACAREHYQTDSFIRWAVEQGSSYGLIFGMQESGDYYYLFDISTQYQAYRVYYRTPSGFTEVVTPAISTAIQTGWGTNRLMASHYDGKLELYINGTQVYNGPDSPYDQPGITTAGVMIMPKADDPYADARFDNYSITTIDSMGFTSMSSDSTKPGQPLPADVDWPLPPLNMLKLQD